MSLFFIFTTAYVIAFSGALMPGPMLTVTIKESILRGGRAGFLIVGGHGFAEILLLGLFVLGLNHLLQIGWISAAVGIGGGTVLLLMGFGILHSALVKKISLNLQNNSPLTNPEQNLSGSVLRPFVSGIVVSLANPTWIFWWFSIGVLYVTEALQQGWLGLSAFFSGHILADLSWYVFIAYAVAAGKGFFSPTVYRGILAACGASLGVFAVFYIAQGVQAALNLF